MILLPKSLSNNSVFRPVLSAKCCDFSCMWLDDVVVPGGESDTGGDFVQNGPMHPRKECQECAICF